MLRIGPLRHIPPWEYGWQPPERFTERCPPDVQCSVNHDDEWNYAIELPWIRLKNAVIGGLMVRTKVGRSLESLARAGALSFNTVTWMHRTAIINHPEPLG